MTRAPLLIELGCEEIPARMIDRATADLTRIVLECLDRAGLERGEAESWGGSRRLAVRVETVQGEQEDRVEEMLGPPAKVAFDADGKPTKAAIGFARKQGIEPEALNKVSTDKGEYAGFRKDVPGRTIEAVLAESLPGAVAGMQFAKSMRWGEGDRRWVRPLHWTVALYGEESLALEILGVPSGNLSVGHRFFSEGPVRIEHPDGYADALRRAKVLVSKQERTDALERAMLEATSDLGATAIPDAGLLDEVSHLVEWPGVVCGSFDEQFLDLPKEILVTTLRHHQKCFSVQSKDGTLAPHFLAVANTDRDPQGHIRRGNEWVVGGRLEDARFFWKEDRKRTLEEWSEGLARVTLHAKLGSYRDKAERTETLANRLGEWVGLDDVSKAAVRSAARLCKADLVTGTVGEFPELQGQTGGLLLREEGAQEAVWTAVYHHYRPTGPEDSIPPTVTAQIVALADKLDSVTQFVARVERPTGSRDPFGLRRAANGIFRILAETDLQLSLTQLFEAAGQNPDVHDYLRERLIAYLREWGAAAGEIAAVLREPGHPSSGWPISELCTRLGALRDVRGRDDFLRLIALTKRVDNILTKNARQIDAWHADDAAADWDETDPAAIELEDHMAQQSPGISRAAEHKQFDRVVEGMASFILPVDRFFEKVLVMDPDHPGAGASRTALLRNLREVLTAEFDIRELAGEAERKV